jgi:hypothetical protein
MAYLVGAEVRLGRSVARERSQDDAVLKVELPECFGLEQCRVVHFDFKLGLMKALQDLVMWCGFSV